LTVFKYRNKSGYRIKTGHRQQYSLIEITSIGGSQDGKAKKAPADTPEAKDSDSVDSNGS